MIITIDISQIAYQTGVSRYTRELVKHLLMRNKSHQYKLFAGAWRQKQVFTDFFQELDDLNLKYQDYLLNFPPKLADIAWNYLRYPKIEKFVGKTDILHTSNWAQAPSKAKIITTVHDLTPIKFPKYHNRSIIINFKTNLRLIAKYCDGVISVSETTKQDLDQYWQDKNIKVKPVVKTIYHGIDQKFKPADIATPKEFRQKYNITGKYILAVGTLEPRKNLHRLIAAFEKLKLTDTQLIIVGKYGWGKDISSNKLPKGVSFTGFVEDDDLIKLYQYAHFFVYPSIYEGAGMPVMEAMQSGCAVIVAKTPALTEIAADAGMIVNPYSIDDLAEAMNSLLQNPALLAKLKQKSLQRAKLFSWDETARQTLKFYKQIAK